MGKIRARKPGFVSRPTCLTANTVIMGIMEEERRDRPKEVVRALDTPPSKRKISALEKTQPLNDQLIEQYFGPQFIQGNIVTYQRKEQSATSFNIGTGVGPHVVEEINFLVLPMINTPEECEKILIKYLRKSRNNMRERMPEETSKSVNNPYGIYYFANRDELWRCGIYPVTRHQAEPLLSRQIEAGDALKKLSI